jgi:hypothetical protein
MKVLIACESSCRVRDAFAALGHEAWSCDLIGAKGNHYQGDIFDLLAQDPEWDLMVAHPPCTFLCSSGLHWNGRVEGREALTAEAIDFAERLWKLPIGKMAIENPMGCLSTRSILGAPTQVIQPYNFGEDMSKTTWLWLRGLNCLENTKFVPPSRIINGKPRWANQTPAGQDKTAPSDDRWRLRSETCLGIADAMAKQWSLPEKQMKLAL